MSVSTDFLRRLAASDARRRVDTAREVLRRIEAGEPLFDSPHGQDVHIHKGALMAHVALLAESVESLLGDTR